MLPLVASRMVTPGRSFPCRSASSIMVRAMRSFTEPPGLRLSSFAHSSTKGRSPTGVPLPGSGSRRMAPSGVSPMRSRGLLLRSVGSGIASVSVAVRSLAGREPAVAESYGTRSL